jgi:WD40 repeat protein
MKYLVSSSYDQTACVIRPDDFDKIGATRWVINEGSSEIHCAAFSPYNDFIITGSKDKNIRVWKFL